MANREIKTGVLVAQKWCVLQQRSVKVCTQQEKIVSCVLYFIISIKTATVLLGCNFHHIYDNLFHGIFKAFSFQFTLSHQTNIKKNVICFTLHILYPMLKSVRLVCPRRYQRTLSQRRIIVQISFRDSVNVSTSTLENPVKMSVSKSMSTKPESSPPLKTKGGWGGARRNIPRMLEGFFFQESPAQQSQSQYGLV